MILELIIKKLFVEKSGKNLQKKYYLSMDWLKDGYW